MPPAPISGNDALHPHIGFGQHAGGERQTAAGPTSRRPLWRCGFAQARRPRHRGVADDHAVDPARARDADDVVEIGSDRSGAIFSSTGVGPACGATRSRASITRAKQIVEHCGLLQVAQARRVGRGNIDGDVARHRREALDQPHIIGDAIGRILVGADIDADDAAGIARAPASRARAPTVGALRIKAEPVDHAAIGIEPEHPRPRIAGLRQRRDGADFDKAEAEAQQRIGHLGVLVEARPPCRSDSEN